MAQQVNRKRGRGNPSSLLSACASKPVIAALRRLQLVNQFERGGDYRQYDELAYLVALSYAVRPQPGAFIQLYDDASGIACIYYALAGYVALGVETGLRKQ